GKSRCVLRQLWYTPARFDAGYGLSLRSYPADGLPALLHPDCGLDRVDRDSGVGTFPRRHARSLPRFSRPLSVRGMVDRGLGTQPPVQFSPFLGTIVLQGLSGANE